MAVEAAEAEKHDFGEVEAEIHRADADDDIKRARLGRLARRRRRKRRMRFSDSRLETFRNLGGEEGAVDVREVETSFDVVELDDEAALDVGRGPGCWVERKADGDLLEAEGRAGLLSFREGERRARLLVFSLIFPSRERLDLSFRLRRREKVAVESELSRVDLSARKKRSEEAQSNDQGQLRRRERMYIEARTETYAFPWPRSSLEERSDGRLMTFEAEEGDVLLQGSKLIRKSSSLGGDVSWQLKSTPETRGADGEVEVVPGL
jgi:hypothetical protein